MSVFLSPVGGAAAQFFDSNGNPLSGGKLFTYAAGTTTPQTTYTSSAGNVAHTNPIVFDSSGRIPGGEIWLTSNLSYKFVLETSVGVLIGSYDNVSAVDVLSLLAAPNGSSLIGYTVDGLTTVPQTVQDVLRRPGIDVRDYGAVGDGTTNDLQAIKDARDQAGALGVPLLFSPGIYGVNDGFSLTTGDCTVVVFSPGAQIKLLSNTSGGGVCAVWDGQPATEQVYIFNAFIDCQSWPGENAMSGVHPVGSNFYNLTTINCEHDNIQPWYGGKGLQWEGPNGTPNCKVFNFVAENCTIGIDIGTPDGLDQGFTHIGVFNASMYDVDIPIHMNDTTGTSVPDSSDSLELYIDGIQCRNCGQLTYPTASALGGGVIVMDRGYKVTVRNMQVVNDQGTYGTTDYGGIGALVRGQGKGLVLENVLFNGTYLASIFDFNPADFQSPFQGDVASYVSATNIRVYGNMDTIVNCLPGGNKLGVNEMRQIEIGSTDASLAAIVSVNAGAYNDSFLELIDRDNGFATTGFLNFKDIYIRGNSITGVNAIAGQGSLAQFNGEWIPTDGSTDALTFAAASGYWTRVGNMATVWAFITYPSTAGIAAARIGSLPFPAKDIDAVIGGGGISKTTTAAVGSVIPEKTSDKATVVSPAGANVANSAMSGQTIAFVLTYPIRIDY